MSKTGSKLIACGDMSILYVHIVESVSIFVGSDKRWGS